MGHAGNGATLTEDALVDAARDGSADAFASLYERHAPQLLHLLTRQTGDREFAADLVQETFMDAWRSIGRLSTERSFVQWLYVIARHNRLAAERRRRVLRLVSLEWLGRRAEPTAAERFYAAIPEADVQQRVLDTLAPTLREVLVLYGIGGFATRDIAAMLGISLDAARQRLTRAKREFAREYRRLHEE